MVKQIKKFDNSLLIIHASTDTTISLEREKCSFNIKLFEETLSKDDNETINKETAISEKNCLFKDFVQILEDIGIKIYSSLISPTGYVYMLIGSDEGKFDQIVKVVKQENQ